MPWVESMSIGSGLGGQVAIAAESTYGTWVTPTRVLEVHSAKLQERINPVQGTGLAAGRSVDLTSRRVNTWVDGGGDVEMEFLQSGMALLLANAMGSSATLTQISSTTAYTLTTAYGAPDNQNYFSMQAGVPDVAGTVHPENFHGCKIAKTTFSIERGGLLTVTFTIDSQYKEESTTLISASYSAASQPFSAVGMSFKIGTYGSEATLDGVRKFELSIERQLDVKRIYLGDQYKSEPITMGVTKISGSLDVDLLSTSQKAQVWDIYHAQTATSLIADFVGSAIGSSGHNNELKLNATSIFVDSAGTPELDGPDIVKATLPFTGLIDTSNDSPLTAVLTTGDTTF